LLTGFALDALGFDIAPMSILPQLLNNITPDGGTSMRDSLLYGCNLMIKLNALLHQVGTANHWNFVHVILTDGADAGSKASFVHTKITL